MGCSAGRIGVAALLCLLLYICRIGPALADPWGTIASDAPDFDVIPKIDRPAFMPIPVEPLLTHSRVAGLLKDAGQLVEQRRLKDAEAKYTRALKKADRLKDPSMKIHGRLHALYGLGEIQIATRRLPESKTSLQEAVTLARSLGEDSIEYGYCLLGLALSELLQREFYAGRDHAQKALEILSATLGESHVDSMEALKLFIDGLANTYDARGPSQIRHLLELSSEALTPDAQERAASLYQHLAAPPWQLVITSKEQAQQMYPQSLEDAQHALRLWETLEPSQLDRITSATSLVGVLQARLRKYGSAELTFKHLLDLKVNSGSMGIETIGTVLALADVMMAQGKAKETCELLQGYRDAALTSPARGRLQAFKLTLMLTRCLVDQGQWAEADLQLREVEKISAADEVTQKSYLASMYAERAVVSLRLKDVAAGKHALDDLNRLIIEQDLTPPANEAMRSYALIGEAWWDLNEVVEAQAYFGRAVTASQFVVDVSDRKVAQLLLLHGLALDAMGGHYPEAYTALTEGMAKYREAHLPQDALWKKAHSLLLLYKK